MKKAARKPKKPITLTEFAKRNGVSRPAVSQAIRDGRLKKSVGRDSRGRPVIQDEALARREWKQNAGTVTKLADKEPVTLSEARRRLTIRKAEAQKIANAIKLGTLIPVALAEREAFEASRTIREAVLNIADRIAAELAAETSEAKVHQRLETELRLALEAASSAVRKKKRAS